MALIVMIIITTIIMIIITKYSKIPAWSISLPEGFGRMPMGAYTIMTYDIL